MCVERCKLIRHPIQIVVGITKAVGDRFGKGGIADRMIWFNGFPFLDSKEEHSFGVPVSHVMTKDVRCLPSTGFSLRAVESLLAETAFRGFPVVEDRTSRILLGYIGRTELRYAIDRVKKAGFLSPQAHCLFSPPSSTAAHGPLTSTAPSVGLEAMVSGGGPQRIDFGRFVDPTPLAVHPRLPLETVMELFKKMGPRVILIDYRGRLAGLVTVKDCLKYQFTVEAHETPRDDPALEEERQQRLWGVIRRVAEWVGEQIRRCSRGRIRLGADDDNDGSTLLASAPMDPRDHLSPIPAWPEHHRILTGTTDGGSGSGDDGGMELQDR